MSYYKLIANKRFVSLTFTIKIENYLLQVIFYFVFCHPSAPNTFEITTNFPKRVLQCQPDGPQIKLQTIEEAGLKNREVLFVHDLEA